MNIVTLYRETEKVCNAISNESEMALKDRATWTTRIEELKAQFITNVEAAKAQFLEGIDAFAYQLSESCVNRAQRMTQTIGPEEPQRIAAE